MSVGSTVGNGETVVNAGLSVKVGAHSNVSRRGLVEGYPDGTFGGDRMMLVMNLHKSYIVLFKMVHKSMNNL